VNDYPRGEVSGLEVYMRTAEEFGFNQRKASREQAAVLKAAEEIRSEIAKVRSSATVEDRDRIKSEIDELQADSETPMERAARRIEERKAKVKAAKKASKADAENLNAHLDDDAIWDEFQQQLDDITNSRASDEDIYAEAQRKAEERLKKLADTDVQMARRDESSVVINVLDTVIGYRRVIHPELSESGVCGICIAASSREYSKSDLEPIHYYCKCETLPITVGFDPGKTMNREALDKLYEQAGGNDIDFLSDTRYQFDEHGELGFVGKVGKTKPNAAPYERRAVNKVNPFFHQQRDAGELNVLYNSVERLKRRYNNGETKLLAPLQWEETRIKQLETRMSATDIRQVRNGTFKAPAKAKTTSEPRQRKVQGHELAGLIANRDVSSELAVLEKNLPVLEEAHANGTNRASAIKYHKERIAKLKKLIGI
jgi:hypothetical protein